MFHVALHYAGRVALGAFIAPHDFRRVVAMRAAGFDGTVPALDAQGGQIAVVVAELIADPEVYGYGIDLSVPPSHSDASHRCA